MRLHNRQVKASFWKDTELLKIKRDIRMFYQGLWQLADDSGCVEYDTFALKIELYPSPMDSDITQEVIEAWLQVLIDMKKLTPYIADSKKCLYISNFHKHQSLKNPAPPGVPLPLWVKWVTYNSNPKTGKYVIGEAESVETFEEISIDLDSSYNVLTEVLQSSSNQNLEPEPEPEQKHISQIDDLRKRYADNHLLIIDQYFDILKHTRRGGKIAISVKLSIYQQWEKFRIDAVIYALDVYSTNPKHHDKKENYCYGIMRNATAEEISNYWKKKNNNNRPRDQDEDLYSLNRAY